MIENEVMEEMAAQALRQEEQQIWDDFHAADLASWEAWAAKQGNFLQGPRKRARVQVLVQGEGGRIVKRENWLFGLREGERLAYSINIVQSDGEQDDDQQDPTAASSGEPAAPAEPVLAGDLECLEEEHELRTLEAHRGNVADTLPISGTAAPDIWDDERNSRDAEDNSKIDIGEVGKFMDSGNGRRFYGLWKDGKVTDRCVGQQFGYAVLGRFYSQRDWDNGVFDTTAAEDCAQGGGHENVNAEREGDPGMVEEVEQGSMAGEAQEGQVTDSQTGDAGVMEAVATMAAVPCGDVAASNTASTAGPSRARTSESSEVGQTGVLTGSRQTSLSHWLL